MMFFKPGILYYILSVTLVFLVAGFGTCLGQTSQKENSVLKPSNIFLKSNNLNTRKFPAISEDGHSVMYIDENYLDHRGELPKKIVVKHKGKWVTSIYLYDYDVEVTQDRIDEFRREDKSEKKKLLDILVATNYSTMTPLESYTIKKKNDSLINAIQFGYKSKVLSTKPLQLRQQSNHSYCCGDPDSTAPCRQQSRVVRLWLDPNEKYVLVEQGEPGMGFGCEMEATYHLLEIRNP